MHRIAQARLYWRALTHNAVSVMGLVLVVFVLVTAVLGPVISPYDPVKVYAEDRLQGPSLRHPLGTDQFGRDVLSRMLYGARISLFVGVLCTAAAAAVGSAIGLIGGYFGGWMDEVLMRTMDILMAFPAIVLAIALIALMGAGFVNLIFVIGIIRIPGFARVIRSSVLNVKEMDYILAARSIGQANSLIVLRHILPNCLTPVVVLASLSIATAISAEAALSFLGLGIQPPTPSWGAMLSEGRAYTLDAPWMAVFPGLAISLTILGYNLLGDGLRDVMDPRTRDLVA